MSNYYSYSLKFCSNVSLNTTNLDWHLLTYPHSYSIPRSTWFQDILNTPANRSNSSIHIYNSVSTNIWKRLEHIQLHCTIPPQDYGKTQIQIANKRLELNIAISPYLTKWVNRNWSQKILVETARNKQKWTDKINI